MKNLIKIFLSLIIVVSFNSCEDGDLPIDDVLANTETGAVLRTLEIISPTFNSSEPDSEFRLSLEEQDEEGGALFATVQIYVSFRDLSPDNGTTVATDAFVKAVPASAFSPGPHGLPRGEIALTFAEAEAAMGLAPDDTTPGDIYVVEVRVELTDGRIYGAASGTGVISGGFFASPFTYNALIVCTPQPGDYRVEMHDSFGDGWQTSDGTAGDGITVDLGSSVIEFGMCSPYGPSSFECQPWPDGIDPTSEFFDATFIVTVPDGATGALWTFPGDEFGEISFEVFGPDGTLLFEGGTGTTSAGTLPILVCAGGM